MKSPAVLLIGKTRAEATLASAALYCAGARLVAQYPVSVITDGMGLNITVMSYCGHMDFGIVADRDQMPDVWSLMDWLREELAELQRT